MSALQDRLARTFSRASDAVLAQALRDLARKGWLEVTPHERMANAWLCDEILRRHPEAENALEAWAEQDEPAATYVETLLEAAGL